MRKYKPRPLSNLQLEYVTELAIEVVRVEQLLNQLVECKAHSPDEAQKLIKECLLNIKDAKVNLVLLGAPLPKEPRRR